MTEINSDDVESYHSWSSNGRWVVFSSRRYDGNYTRPFIAYIDKDGKGRKPFELPQEVPDMHRRFMRSYNIPEFMNGPVEITPQAFASLIRDTEANRHGKRTKHDKNLLKSNEKQNNQKPAAPGSMFHSGKRTGTRHIGRLPEAYSLYEKFNATQVYNDPADIRWDGKTAFHYSVYTPEGTDYYVGKVTGDVKTADVKAIHMKALAELLSRETGKDIPRNTLRLSRLSVDENQPTSVSFEFDGYKWKVEEACTDGLRLGNKETLPAPKGPWKKPRHWMEVDDEKGAAPVVSPDGKRQAYIKNDNVYVSDRDGRHERALSNDGTAGNYYSSWLKWSPDGRYVCANKIRPAQKRYVYYVESSPKSQLQPILHQQEYAKPGDELRFKVPCIFNVETGQAVIPSTELFDRQYDLYGPEWKEDGKAVTFEYNERGHKTYRVLELDAETGKVRTLVRRAAPPLSTTAACSATS